MKFGMVPQALPGSDRGEKAAVFNHKDIRPALPEPEEFNEFWRRGLAEVAAVPRRMSRRKRIRALCDGRREVCRISFATVGGGRIYGFLTRPAGRGRSRRWCRCRGRGREPGRMRNRQTRASRCCTAMCSRMRRPRIVRKMNGATRRSTGKDCIFTGARRRRNAA